MSEPSYKDGEVVWVKWSSCWWPGEVWSSSRVPGDILTSLRKPVIAFVKFFQEESFEFVRSHNNIMKYNCEQKLDYIKRGMDKHRTNNKKMSNFPADVTKAEQLTGGNENILTSFETPKKQKQPSSAFATPEKSFTETTPVAASKKSGGAYNSSSKVQVSANPAPKSDKKFTCTLCDFSTERMNLLMFHIKNHSSSIPPRVNDPLPTDVKKVSAAKSLAKKYIEPNDSIADDVRKIKESMKKEPKPSTSTKKSREQAKSTPTGRASRSAKKEEKVVVKEEVVAKIEEKPKLVNELKNELLADWMDDDDSVEKVEELPKSPPPPKIAPVPVPALEKVGESSRSIRNIPKKRGSEIYIKSEPMKIEQLKLETPAKESLKKVEPTAEVALPEVSNKTPKATKRKFVTAETVSEPEPKKLPEETDESLLMATAELLNDTEVPKVESAQRPSTFHKSNDIDKRNLPPKERNKRIFRSGIGHESPPPKVVEPPAKPDNNGSMTKESEPVIASLPIQNELMLPHKKKHSSRLLTSDKPSPVRETRSVRDVKQDTPALEPRTRKKRKSTETNLTTKSAESLDAGMSTHELPSTVTTLEKQEAVQSPLRDAIDVNNEVNSSESAASATSNFISKLRRGVKRRNSQDPHELTDNPETCSEPKKIFKPDVDSQRIVVACSSETICISSKGHLSVARRDSVVTTQASTVVVTSQVIITEATHPPVVSTAPITETVFVSKPIISATVKIPHQSLALKFPAEELMEMKKQGLVTVGVDKKNKFTEKGKQIYKKIKEKTAEVAIEQVETVAPEPEQSKTPELPSVAAQTVEKVAEVEEVLPEPVETTEQENVELTEDKVLDETPGEEKKPEAEEPLTKESNGTPALENEVEESTNNNEVEKETILAVELPAKEAEEDSTSQEPIENGKEADNEQDVLEDPNNSGAGLIALQAETFGGPPNCFYLCRQVEDRYEPVDNQILVLNAHNALVPYEGDLVSEDSLVPSEVATENLTGYPQLSPGSNIIINTPMGQKIELSHIAILQLQEQADENGMATVEMSGEQLELNINGILEAISAQQEANEGEALLPGAVLIDGDGALILETTELPVEMHHSATQVSETLSKPIMSASVAPEINLAKTTMSENISTKNLNIEDSLATIGVTTQLSRSNALKSLELPITITNQTIVETVNHRKLVANAQILGELAEVAIEAESFVVGDNGSQD